MPLVSTPRCILLVEDHASSREALTALLSRLGFVVCAVENLQEAHAALDGQNAALLDLNLPDGNGAEILKRIRTEEKPIRVAITSAMPLAQAHNTAPGADLYIQKPITAEKLAVLVEWLKQG